MIIHRGIEQGSQEWLMLRLGKITGSKFSDVMTNGRGNAPSKTRLSYMMQLAAEIITGAPIEQFKSSAMEWGNTTEPQARAAYQLKTGNDVDCVTFVEHSDFVGYSPDGLVNDDGLLEIKCPNTTTQIARVLEGVAPSDYSWQMQGGLWVCERDWCDFVSYDPRILTGADYFSIRVYRDESAIKNLADECDRFKDELLEMIEKLQ